MIERVPIVASERFAAAAKSRNAQIASVTVWNADIILLGRGSIISSYCELHHWVSVNHMVGLICGYSLDATMLAVWKIGSVVSKGSFLA